MSFASPQTTSNDDQAGRSSAWLDRADSHASQRFTAIDAQKHTRRVRHLRLVVPAAAAGLLMTYALSATPPKIDPTFAREFSNINTDSQGMRLDRPRYVGEDLSGQPFEVSARSALRDPDAPDMIALDNLEAFRDLDSDEDVRLRAEAGVLDTEANRMDLSEDVQLQHRLAGETFILNTDAAQVDLNTNTVTSTVGVQGSGERGAVAADTATAYQDEQKLVLEGNVRIILNPRQDGAAGTAGLR